MQRLFLFLTLFATVHLEELSSTEKPSVILKALAIYNDPSPSPRTKRQCSGGCGSRCSGYGCNGGCRGGHCGGYSGCRGGHCGCNNPCGAGGRLCCDNVAPRPCVNCGLSRGIFPEPMPLAVGVGGTCCACCMPLCVPRCVNFGCGSCGAGYGFGGYGFGGGYDYFDYFG